MRHVNDTWKWFNDVFCSLNCEVAGANESVSKTGTSTSASAGTISKGERVNDEAKLYVVAKARRQNTQINEHFLAKCQLNVSLHL